MKQVGYKPFLELGYSDPKSGNFISFKEPYIELESVSYALMRSIDARGKIASDLHGGNLSFLLSGLPTPTFLDWATNSNKYYSGYIHIQDVNKTPRERLFFENATCVQLKITYTNEGEAYVLVEGVLQAETIQLEGARVLYNGWNNEKERNSSRISINQVNEQITDVLLNSEASISVSMLIGATTYPLQHFEIEFIQEIDHKGEPQSSVKGGIATVGLYTLPDVQLNGWIRNNTEFSGRFLFGDKLMGYPLSIEFKQAGCLGCFVEINNQDANSVTARLSIVPKQLDFGNDIRFKVPY